MFITVWAQWHQKYALVGYSCNVLWTSMCDCFPQTQWTKGRNVILHLWILSVLKGNWLYDRTCLELIAPANVLPNFAADLFCCIFKEPLLSTSPPYFVTTANLLIVSLTCSSKSFMNITNNNIPCIVPCGTSLAIFSIQHRKRPFSPSNVYQPLWHTYQSTYLSSTYSLTCPLLVCLKPSYNKE